MLSAANSRSQESAQSPLPSEEGTRYKVSQTLSEGQGQNRTVTGLHVLSLLDSGNGRLIAQQAAKQSQPARLCFTVREKTPMSSRCCLPLFTPGVFKICFAGQSSTLNPQPSSLSPEPSTLNPEPWTLNPEP